MEQYKHSLYSACEGAGVIFFARLPQESVLK